MQRGLDPAGCDAREPRVARKVVAGGKVQRYETQRLHKDGTLVDVAITAGLRPSRRRRQSRRCDLHHP